MVCPFGLCLSFIALASILTVDIAQSSTQEMDIVQFTFQKVKYLAWKTVLCPKWLQNERKYKIHEK